MAESAAAGVLPHLFWDYTYRELFAVLEGAAKVRNRRHQDLVFGAWKTEYYARVKRLPDLKSELRKFEPPRVMSAKSIRRAVLGMAKAMGAKVTIRKKGEA